MTAPVEPGTVLGGKFRVEKVLGHGGMGVVVAAHHLQLDERVALKFLLPEALGSRESVARFEREARAAFKIKSEHVARISDVGFLETGAPYMVMEYLNGKDLSAIVEERGPLPIGEVADYLLQACEAIAEAHSIGIVHRDLKPANLFVVKRADGSPCVKVLDFGISKVSGLSASTGDHSMTRTNAIMGSPLYMSPEQLASARDVDMRTDVWAMGVILFELLTGSHPFEAETLPQLITLIVTAQPNRLSVARADLPLAVEELVMACLQKDRALRLPSIAEFAMRLVEFAPRRSRLSAERISRLAHASGISSSDLVPPSSRHGEPPPPPPNGGTMRGLGGTIPQASQPRWIIVTAATLLAVGLGGGLLLGRRNAEAPEGQPAAAVQSPVPPQQPQASPKPADIAAPAPPTATIAAQPTTSATPSATVTAGPPRSTSSTARKPSTATTAPHAASTSRPIAPTPTAHHSQSSVYDDRK